MIHNHYKNKKVLTLSPNYEPIGAIPWERAMSLLFSNKILVLERYKNIFVRSPSSAIPMPSVIVFKNNHRKLKRAIRFSRNNVWLRDEGKCQYCMSDISISDFTLDHVVPKTRGGISSWDNVVTCCYACNQKKGEKSLQECRLKLHKQPCKPLHLPFTTDVQSLYSEASRTPPEWNFYLGIVTSDADPASSGGEDNNDTKES